MKIPPDFLAQLLASEAYDAQHDRSQTPWHCSHKLTQFGGFGFEGDADRIAVNFFLGSRNGGSIANPNADVAVVCELYYARDNGDIETLGFYEMDMQNRKLIELGTFTESEKDVQDWCDYWAPVLNHFHANLDVVFDRCEELLGNV
ncbi:MAG TPA: hypothetical protein VEJ63_03945 [Planctomycetota bacterium]|nr:hypothetical protein [Planctomycetota bacterium]